jgi:hydroxymethylbilane synthase
VTGGALRLATRGSPLALAQAALAEAALRRQGVEEVETVVIRTQGDRAADTPVERLEGEGWFTVALEQALLDGRADVAVHSAKDLPNRLAPGLPVAAFLERADCRDGLVTRVGARLDDLPEGARVGTSSARRAALLAGVRPDLRAVPIRGNVDTRLSKLDAGEVDAILVACAGLDRIGRSDRITMRLDPAVFVPAPCQGAIALQASAESSVAGVCGAADDPATRAAATAERAVLAALGGGCLLPLGAWARQEAGRLLLTAALGGDLAIRRAEGIGDPGAPAELGTRVAGLLG